jgi:hypothetical protein
MFKFITTRHATSSRNNHSAAASSFVAREDAGTRGIIYVRTGLFIYRIYYLC